MTLGTIIGIIAVCILVIPFALCVNVKRKPERLITPYSVDKPSAQIVRFKRRAS